MKIRLDSINALDILLGNKIQPEENDTGCENRQQLMVPALLGSVAIFWIVQLTRKCGNGLEIDWMPHQVLREGGY
jgi:hypothetical protein